MDFFCYFIKDKNIYPFRGGLWAKKQVVKPESLTTFISVKILHFALQKVFSAEREIALSGDDDVVEQANIK